MVESIFQTLLLLAYFNIALLAITIANYAVSASYLGRESNLSRWRMGRRKQKLLEKLKELRETTQIDSIKNEIGEAEAEQRGLGLRIFLLSWLGAVILPSMFFVISFVCSVFGMNAEIHSQDPETQRFLEQQLVIFSSGTLATGFVILLSVIRTIDSAAKKVPIPEFDVYFKNLMKTLKLKRKETAIVSVCIRNKGEDIAEDVLTMTHFPPAFKVHLGDYTTCKQGPEADHPDYDSAIFNLQWIHIDTIVNEDATITTPDETKSYEIYVDIYERKTGTSKHKLTIQVVDQL
jgi:hypothetical protein